MGRQTRLTKTDTTDVDTIHFVSGNNLSDERFVFTAKVVLP